MVRSLMHARAPARLRARVDVHLADCVRGCSVSAVPGRSRVAAKKKKPCPPCKTRKKGKCKVTLPDGTAGAGGTCQGGKLPCGRCRAPPPPSPSPPPPTGPGFC